jgi:hypothetical protein
VLRDTTELTETEREVTWNELDDTAKWSAFSVRDMPMLSVVSSHADSKNSAVTATPMMDFLMSFFDYSPNIFS